jgi:SMODS and SLOG-associating 2TM effector domain family 5
MSNHSSPLGTQRLYAVDLQPEMVVPITNSVAASKQTALPGMRSDSHAADKLVAKFLLVKSARFNAAARLERKQTVSLATQSIVALYFIGVSVFQAVYFGQIDDATNRLLTFVQIVSSVFTLILGLLEALNDYQLKAHHLNVCALEVSELAQELEIANVSDRQVIQDFRRRYSEALRNCPANHSRLDFQFAMLDGKGDARAWSMIYARYLIDVYGFYAIFLSVPPLLWWLHH